MIKSFTSYLYHNVYGWKIVDGEHIATTKRCIIIGVPHTSWHDFFLGIAVRKILGLKISFLAKEELFKWPIGWFMRKMGGIGIDRTSGQNKVEAIAAIFKNKEILRIALSPEGTRKKVEKWKTGFYHIAKAAKVPILMFTYDFENKQNLISKPFYPTDNQEADFKFMYDFYKGVKGKIPENSFGN